MLALEGLDGTPLVLHLDKSQLQRTFIDGRPMHHARPHDPAYFRQCARLLRRLHAADVVHNDLAKEPNILVRDDGTPAFVDYQLAWYAPGRGWLFRLLAWDDIRHLLKHKRTYCPGHLTTREKNILARPSMYQFVTRRLLGWADREGAHDRGERR